MKTSIMKKNRMALALPLVLVFSGMSFATGGDLGGTAYDGSEAAPYQISDADDLKAFASIVNGGKYSANAVLTADICLNACGEGESVLKADGTLNGSGFEQWTPIGTESNLFAGTFEGNSHAIRGLYINDKDKDYAALFGDVASTAKIQNVGVVDSYIKGKAWVGSIAGVNEGSISNVYNTGFVSGNGNYVGGVVGYNKKGSASNAYNIGSVSGTGKYVGGLIGYNSNGSISNVYNTGSVCGTGKYVGGLIGYNSNGSISNVYNTGSVSGSSSHVGGVVGINYGSVSGAYNTGSVSGSSSYVGGVVGINYGSVSGAYNTGSVSGSSSYVGGVVGLSSGTSASVSNSYYNTDFFSESNGYGEGKTSAELAALNVATAFLSETGVWSAGDADGDIIKLPYLTSFGETSQPQVAHVTFFDDGEAFVKKIPVQVGSKIPLAEVPTLDELEFFGWYGNVSDESTKWSFENGVVTKNISLKAMAIGVVGDVYQIANAVNLKAFASIVNGGKYSANAVLTADICLNACGEGESVLKVDGTLNGSGFEQWTPIGTKSKLFVGTFEGNSHAIRGLYINDDTKNYVGLFGYAGSDAKIQNVGVVDSYVKGNSYVGGVVGYNYEGTVSNAYSTGSVNGSSSYVGGVVGDNVGGSVSNVYSTGSVSGKYDIGGVVGDNQGTVSNAYSTGSVSGKYDIGGVVGRNYEGSVSNAYNTGSVSGSDYVGGVIGENTGSSTVSNVYSTGSVNGTGGYVGGVVGYNVGTVSYGYYNITTCPACEGAINGSDDIANSVVGKSMTELANLDVETAFTFGEGEKNPWEAGKIDGFVCKFPYISEFGIESQPAITMATVTVKNADGKTVLGTMTLALDSKISQASLAAIAGYKILGLYSDLDEQVLWDYDNGVVKGDTTLFADAIGYVDGIYQIASAANLKVFASIVNGGEKSANAVLTADICLNACGEGESLLKADGTLNGSGFEQWTPIGTSEKPYKGTFDGNGHTIRGLYINDEDKDFAALFGDVASTAKLQNVGVVDSYVKGKSYVGGVVGYNDGTVSNVYSTGSVSGSSSYVGGVVGYNDGTVSNVYSTGSVSGSSYYVGGVVGRNEGTVSNVYSTGSVNGDDHVGGVVGCNYDGTVSNGYFNIATCSACEGAINGSDDETNSGKTSAELAALNVATAFSVEEGVESPWTAGSVENGDGYVTYKLPYLAAFDAASQPTISPAIEFAAGNASATVYGATTGSVNIASDIEVSGTITFKRSFPNLSADNAFSTIMLPFTPISVPEGVTFYEFVGASENGGKWTVSVSEATEIAANTPYLVKVAGGAESIEFAGGTFKATEGEHGVTQGNWKFVGTYEYKQWLEGNAGLGKTYGYVGAAGNAATEVGKFKKAGAGAYIYPMRAYLEYSASAGRPAANGAKPAVASLPDEIEVVIVEKDETTGEQTTRVIGKLDTRTGEFKFATDRWFDLNGRYLGNKKPTQKGAYYNNGKKVIVK